MTRQRTLTLLLFPAAVLLPACSPRSPSSLIRATGHVEATEVRVATKIGGRLDALTLEEGDRLERGQTIAQIDTVDLQLALDAAAAERARAAAELALLEAGYRKEEIAEAEAQVEQARAELANAELRLARLQGLLDAGSGTAQGRDDAVAAREVAAARRAAAGERLRKLRAGFRREEIDAARARVGAADARIAQLRQQIGDATVTAPVGGIVTEKVAEEGELLAAGELLAVVTDLGDAWLTIYVAEPDLGRIRIGQPARVVTDGGEERTGRVSFVATQAEFTPKNVQTRDERVKLVYEVKVALDNADGLFKPGMPATAELRPAGSSS
jgi:HlyD family secretion protein